MKIVDRIVLRAASTARRAPLPAGSRTAERRLAAAKLLATLSECRDWAPSPERLAKVEVLRNAVKSGTYRIDYQRTARAMLGEIIGEALA
jgi:anti-sigma28 factor (negative regulator of flagellin synthesis)